MFRFLHDHIEHGLIHLFSFPLSISQHPQLCTFTNLKIVVDFSFRSGDEAEANADGGAGMKVKEAVTKSLGKSKATVEDSAKSAAKIASETAKKTKEKVRNSFSEREAEMRCEL